MTMMNKRYDFVFFYDVQDGNPNGDPDAGNLPRIDPETGEGLVSDVCLKRKVRNYVEIVQQNKPGYEIFIKEKAVLNRAIDAAWEEASKEKTGKQEVEESARQKMCSRFFDIRTFGAVMTTGKGAGQVRGPIQMTFSRSVEPIIVLEHSITRMAVTNEKDVDKERTMGRKFTVPYALYRAHGFISPNLAQQTGFSLDDLAIFWKSLENMFDVDRSASRGLMATRNIIIFEHESALGNAPAQMLFERVRCQRVTEGPARSFGDYKVTLDGEKLTDIRKIINVGG